MLIKSKHLARIGEFYLEEAVLDVLLEARLEAVKLKHENRRDCLGPFAISMKAGIFREPGSSVDITGDAIVFGILNKLLKAGKVERCEQSNGRGGWKLTEKGIRFARR